MWTETWECVPWLGLRPVLSVDYKVLRRRKNSCCCLFRTCIDNDGDNNKKQDVFDSSKKKKNYGDLQVYEVLM